MAIITSESLIGRLANTKSILTEFFGLPDCGASSLAVKILTAQPFLYQGAFFVAQDAVLNYAYLRKVFGEEVGGIVFCFYENEDEPERDSHISLKKLLAFIEELGRQSIKYIIFDDFSRVILHRPKNEIKKFISELYIALRQHDMRAIIISQLRYDLSSENGEAVIINGKRYVTLYRRLLKPYIADDDRYLITKKCQDINIKAFKKPGDLSSGSILTSLIDKFQREERSE